MKYTFEKYETRGRTYDTIFSKNPEIKEALNKIASLNIDFSTLSTTKISDCSEKIKFYQRRQEKEVELLRKILLTAENSLLLLVGPEGIGKTSLIEYCFGYKIRTDNYLGSNLDFDWDYIRIDAKNFVDINEVDQFRLRLAEKIYLKICIRFGQKISEYDIKAEEIKRIIPIVRTSRESAGGGEFIYEFVRDFLSYISAFNLGKSIKIFLSIDNSDQLTSGLQFNFFRALSRFLSDIKDTKASFLDVAKNDGADTSSIINIVMPI